MTHEAKHCPKCGGEAVPIIYSAPLLVPGGSRPDIFKAEDRGELRWGGCLIDSGSPGWYCKKWDLSFGGRDDVHVAKQGSEPHPTVPILDHIRLVILGSRLPCFSGAGAHSGRRPAAATRGCEASQVVVAVEPAPEGGADADFTVVRWEVARRRATGTPTSMGVVVRSG